jgi:hypothetical protein
MVSAYCFLDVAWNDTSDPANDIKMQGGGAVSNIITNRIEATKSTMFLCNVPDKIKNGGPTDTMTGKTFPIRIGLMRVRVSYETWWPLFWSVRREERSTFTLFNTSSGFRWVKGDWMGLGG